MTAAELETFAETLAERWLTFDREIEMRLKALSDADLEEVFAHYEHITRGFPDLIYARHMAGKAAAEKGFRFHDAWAKALGCDACDAYCVFHACDARHCPPGAHD